MSDTSSDSKTVIGTKQEVKTPGAFDEARKRADADSQGEDMAYAAESVLACFATDFIDITLSAREQANEAAGIKPGKWSLSGVWNRFFGHGDHDGHDHGPKKNHFIHPGQAELPFETDKAGQTKPLYAQSVMPTFWGSMKSQLGHVIGGEVIGDLTSMPTLLFIQRRFPKAMAWMTEVTEAIGQPFYDVGAKMALRGWAKEHALKAGDPEYDARIQKWKDQQHGNLAKSAIITVSSVVGNIGVQMGSNLAHSRMSENHHMPSLGAMLRGKVKGAVTTFVVVMGLRVLLPEKMKKLDKWASQKFFAPVLRKMDSHKHKDVTVAEEANAIETKSAHAGEVNNLEPSVASFTAKHPRSERHLPEAHPVTFQDRVQVETAARTIAG